MDSITELFGAIREAFPAAVTEFQSRWDYAQATCRSQSTTARDDACTRTKEFDALYRLGPKAIPFVVFKIAHDNAGQDSWAVFLYNALEGDANYRPSLQGEQDLRHYMREIVELNHRRNNAAKERIKAWKEHHVQNKRQSTTAVFTECEEYWDLLEMGPGIIAHLMVAYCELKTGAWYELLHEILNGHKMGAYMVDKAVLFDAWYRWFSELEYRPWPKYIRTDLDHLLCSMTWE